MKYYGYWDDAIKVYYWPECSVLLTPSAVYYWPE